MKKPASLTEALQLEKWRLPPPPDPARETWHVQLLSDPDDYHVCLLASLGMSYKVIRQQTGLSFGQISYRLRQANRKREPWERISAANYRNGSSASASAVIHLAAKKVAALINPELRKTLAVDV